MHLGKFNIFIFTSKINTLFCLLPQILARLLQQSEDTSACQWESRSEKQDPLTLTLCSLMAKVKTNTASNAV